MIWEIIISESYNQTVDIQINNKNYHLELFWNASANIWIMNVYKSDGQTPIIRGLSLVLGQELLAPYNLNIGQLVVLSFDATGLDATEKNLQTAVKLVWLSSDESIKTLLKPRISNA